MKNKFKKSKIIVPALALITATTVASVTGTVAWFTANRTVNVSTGSFAVTTAEGDLKVTGTALQGVTCENANGTTTVNIGKTTVGASSVENKLLDASFNGTTTRSTDNSYINGLFTDIANPGSGENDPKFTNVNWLYNNNFYYAFNYKLTFSIDVSNVTSATKYAVFFDSTNSSGTANGTTDKGLRIQFQGLKTTDNSTVDNTITWSPLNTSATACANGSNGGYVSSTTTTANYTAASTSAHGLFGTDNKLALCTDGIAEAKAKSRGDYLGTAANVASSNPLTAQLQVNVVVWYEGLDATVVSSDSLQLSSVTTTMKFYARQLA